MLMGVTLDDWPSPSPWRGEGGWQQQGPPGTSQAGLFVRQASPMSESGRSTPRGFDEGKRRGRRQASLQQFREYLDPLAGIDDRDRAVHTSRVILPLVVDAEDRADGAQEVGHADRAFGHRGTVPVGLAHDLAALDAAADQH